MSPWYTADGKVIVAHDEAEAKAMVMKDPRVQKRAKTMQGFDGNIGKYISLAYLEAEKEIEEVINRLIPEN